MRFKQWLIESKLPWLYHKTNVPPYIVLRDGLDTSKSFGTGATIAGSWPSKMGWIPRNCVYLGLNPYRWPGEFTYIVRIDNLKTYPDYPSLVGKGAILEESGMIWWKRDVPKVLLNRYDEEEGIHYSEITGEDTLEIAGSLCIQGPIPPERIMTVEGEPSHGPFVHP